MNEPEQIQQGIQREFSTSFGRADDSCAQLKDHLRSNTHLTDAERLDLVAEVYDRADEDYQKAVAERREAVMERKGALESTIFDAPTTSSAEAAAFTNAMTTATTADDDTLGKLAERAAKTHDEILAKAAFVEAHSRGLDHVALRALNASPELLAAFQELGSLPTDEELDRAEDFRFPRPTLEDIQPSREAKETAQRIARSEQMKYARRAAGYGE